MERERLVLPDDADLVRAVGRLDLIERRLDARAERALEVGEDDDGDGRVAACPTSGSLLVTGIGESLSAHRRCRPRRSLSAVMPRRLHAVAVVAPHDRSACEEAEDESDDGHAGAHPSNIGGRPHIRGLALVSLFLWP